MIGQALSHYKIRKKLGAGGMGEVYVAEDTKLGREIALKVLTPELATSERIARFEREAEAVAALNHPNIVHVYSVEETDGVHFITMELVKGKTLTELIPNKGLPLNKFFEIAIPLADAVSAAHDKGIVHRDLKPDNLMVSDEGRLKILDFGLAKLKQEFVQEGISELPTQTATQEGRILGTVNYMSPEQAEGKAVDHRSDIFSIGIILYEMATGQRPFKGDTPASILSSIIKDTPDSVTNLNPNLPRDLGKLIRRCLAKNPEDRLQAAKDLRNELRELKQEVESGEVFEDVPTAKPRDKRLALAVIAALVFVAGVVGYMLRSGDVADETSGPPSEIAFTQLTSQAGEELFPSLSPDGDFAAYCGRASGNWDIYLQRVGGEQAINLTPDSPDDDTQPSFSPDGEQIIFRSERDGGGIFVMGATGESVRRLTDFGFNPVWSPDGSEILCATSNMFDDPMSRNRPSKIWAVNVANGEKRLITEGEYGEGDGVQPNWSPHGHRIAYWSLTGGTQRDIFTVSAEGGEAQHVTNDEAVDWSPVWSPDGHYLYFVSNRGGSMNLWRVPMDEPSGNALGEPEPITTPSSRVENVSISGDGRRIAYASVVEDINIYKIKFDPSTESVSGPPIPITRGSRSAMRPSLSPDNRQIAIMLRGEWEDIAVIDNDGNGLRKLTDDPWKDREPRWSPDGTQIAFYSDRSGKLQIWSIHPDGSGLRQLTEAPTSATSLTWSPDGSSMVINWTEAKSIFDPRKPWREQTLQDLPSFGSNNKVFSVNNAKWSPDGRLLAGGVYNNSTNRREDIAIYNFDSKLYEVLTDFGSIEEVYCLRWLNDSRRLLFLYGRKLGGKIMLLDSRTREQREVLSLAPDIVTDLDISKDNEFIYFTRIQREADIWMLTLNEK